MLQRLGSYLASPLGRMEHKGQAHLCEALLQAEAEPKPRAKPDPENFRTLSMVPLALTHRPSFRLHHSLPSNLLSPTWQTCPQNPGRLNQFNRWANQFKGWAPLPLPRRGGALPLETTQPACLSRVLQTPGLNSFLQ